MTDSHHNLEILREVDPLLIRTDISNRVMMPMWQHVAKRYGEESARKMLEMVGVPAAYMEDPTRWVGLEYSRRMVEVMAREIHGLDHLPDIRHPMWEFYRESGQRSLSKEALGTVWYAMRLLGSPRMLYENIPSQARRMNLLTHFEVVEYGYGHAVIAAWPERGYDLASFCKSRRGYLEAVPTLWGYPPALVEHPECIHDPTNPSHQCLYRVTFREFGRLPRAMVQTLVMSAAVATGSGLVLGNVFDPWGAALGAFVTAGLAGWWFFMRQYFRERSDSRHIEAAIERFDRRHQEVLDSETLFRQLAGNVNELFWLAGAERERYDYLSPHFEPLFGFEPARLLEDPVLWEKAVHEEDRSARQAWILGGGLGETTYRIRRPGGEIRWLRERVFPVGVDDEPVSRIAGLCEDITEKIRAEERLQKQEEELRQA